MKVLSRLKPTTAEVRRTVISLLIFYGFFGFCMAIFLYRGGMQIWGQVPLVRNFLTDQHISNFALSGILTLTAASYPAARRQYWAVGIIAILVIALNLYTESGNHFANVPDPLDALAGTLGVLSAVIAIWLIKTFGSYEPRR